MEQPDWVWSIDFKGWFLTLDGQRCDPLTISDGASRYLLRCQAVARPDGQHVRPLLEATFREYGLPWVMRSDNGPPFATVGVHGLSRLAVWWIKLGIVPERIEPGHPEQNGRHERMHRTLKQETAQPPRATRRAQQRAFDGFRREHNEQRPHQGLKLKTPAECYRRSLREYPSRLEEPKYPGEWEVRRVSKGEIRWRVKRVYVGNSLNGERVGLEPLPPPEEQCGSVLGHHQKCYPCPGEFTIVVTDSQPVTPRALKTLILGRFELRCPRFRQIAQRPCVPAATLAAQ